MVLSLRTMRANAPHQWCGGSVQSLRGVSYPYGNTPFGLKKGYKTSETRAGYKQKTKSNT